MIFKKFEKWMKAKMDRLPVITVKIVSSSFLCVPFAEPKFKSREAFITQLKDLIYKTTKWKIN